MSLRRALALFVLLLVFASFVYAQSFTAPRTWVTSELVTASLLNTHVRDNLIVLRAGGIAVTSQAANDLIYASSSTQLARIAGAASSVLVTSGASVQSLSTTLPSGLSIPGPTLSGTVAGTPTIASAWTWSASQPITLSTAAQGNVTSLGTLTTLTVDDITINGNTISSAGASTLAITPTAGQAITFDGTVTLDAGVIAGATSITSTTFVGALTGNASGSAATVTGAAQTAITSLGTLTAVTVSGTSALAQGSAAIATIGGGATASELRFLEPSGSGTNYSAFKAVAQAANITYSLPPAVGAANTFLTDVAGNGVLTWAT